MLAFVLLAQVAIAIPTPRPTFTPLPRTVNANEGLSGLAKGKKINKVDFSDVKKADLTVDQIKPKTDPACKAKEFAQKLHAVVEKFAGIESVAGTTSRIALGGPMTEMAKTRAEASAVAGPPCAEYAKGFALAYMDASISEFQAFQMEMSAGSARRVRARDQYLAEIAVLLNGQ